MFGFTEDRNQFLPLSRHDSGDVLLQLFAALRGNYTHAAGNREDGVQVYLSVGVCHFAVLTCRSYGAVGNLSRGL
jgi:hypothetical protein